MKVVVVGFGSIGKRHVNNLISLGINDIILCRTKSIGNDLNLKEISSLHEILKVDPDFVIVSNPTSLHYKTIQFLIENNINVLAEKPLIHVKDEWEELEKCLNNYTGIDRVVFNLRFHPCVQKVKSLITENRLGKTNYARFFVGQYLPDWRPNTNHLKSYSALKSMGGGVVLDLVHEIDIAEYLLGKPLSDIKFFSEKTSNVTVDSYDVSELIYKTNRNNIVNIHLDYLYRGYSRNFLINGSILNLYCDLHNNKIDIIGDSNEIVETFVYNNYEKNAMYIDVLKDYLKALNKESSILPSFIENKSVMNTCFIVNN